MTASILEARDLVKRYRVGERSLTVIAGVSLAVAAAEFLVVTGPSGSGKSTLISLLSGLDEPTSGQVFLAGHVITGMPEEKLAPIRMDTRGFVFQSYHLIPSLTARENVMFPAELKGDGDAGRRADALLENAGLLDRAENFPHQLSGGEKQRVAVCRALVNEPAIVFADEPTGNLDSASGKAVLDLLRSLQREKGAAIVMVTHSAEIAATADRVLTLVDGLIVGQER